MRIGCLQFAPQVGDVDNNLNRADAILVKANPEDVDALDLLVLPELAFTGYNFKSLQHISPFLESSGSGISSLWARTTALKYNCAVVVGYPEKVDVAQNWPTSPEYYNSAIMVNGDGETVANYRKSFLYMIDESWALEGRNGFFGGHIEGLGDTAMGICMDINPYKFEASWHAFEFAFHVLEVKANLVIVTMAWLTLEDSRMFSSMPQEPDIDTLTYWIQRLDPIIRAEKGEETIVVFCNRTGSEDETIYAGTSAVVGIKNGEVNVYGLLGRGVKELLIVDTDNAPYAKLVLRPDGETQEIASDAKSDSQQPQSPAANKTLQFSQTSSRNTPALPSSTKPLQIAEAPRSSPSRNTERPSPKVEIPPFPSMYTRSRESETLIDESPTIPTPTGPSPVPRSLRPQLTTPEAGQPYQHVASPYPHDNPTEELSQIFIGNVSINEEHFSPSNVFKELATAKFSWVQSDTLPYTPMEPAWMPVPPNSAMVAKIPDYVGKALEKTVVAQVQALPSPESESSSSSVGSQDSRKAADQAKPEPQPEARITRDTAPPRPSSPKSRNASRNRHDRRGSEVEQLEDIAAVARRLVALTQAHTPANDFQTEQTNAHDATVDRPRPLRSRNASRTKPIEESNIIANEQLMNLSRSSIPISASPSIFQNNGFQAPQRVGLQRPSSSLACRTAVEELAQRPPSRPGSQPRPGPSTGRFAEGARSQSTSGNAKIDPAISGLDRPPSRRTMRSQTPRETNNISDRPPSRNTSRGRPRVARRKLTGPTQASNLVNAEHRQVSRGHLSKDRSSSLGTSTGDDEIIAIAELISPECQVHGNRASSHSSNNSPRPMATITRISRHLLNHTYPIEGRSSAEISIYKAPSPFDVPPNKDVSERCTIPSRMSIKFGASRTATASPRFEPRTPKAMALTPGDGGLISPTSLSGPTKTLKHDAFGGLEGESGEMSPLSSGVNAIAVSSGFNRRKSAVW